jgi:hypothetical protein
MSDVQVIDPATQHEIKRISEIDGMDSYLRNYGSILGKKAIHALEPLHIPNEDPLLDFDAIVDFNPDREPFPAQAHVITAAVKMMQEVGSGFICGEMGTGKDQPLNAKDMVKNNFPIRGVIWYVSQPELD